MTRRLWILPSVCLTALLFGAPLAAGELLRYSIDIPQRNSVTYELDIPVEYAGDLRVHATWSGTRTIALRLEAPDAKQATARRSGPSPLHLGTQVEPNKTGNWKLSVYSLAGRSGGEGLLTIELPDRPGLRVRPTAVAPGAAAVAPEPWQLPIEVPPGLTAPEREFLGATEQFRRTLLKDTRLADNCRWQSALLRYLHEQGRQLTAGGDYPPKTTRDLLEQIASAIDRVDQLSRSKDPMIAGPAPTKPRYREAWIRVRAETIQQIEQDLDAVLQASRRGYAPELAAAEWTTRLVSCVTACQRHFEERGRLGQERAINRELTAQQWDRLLSVRNALRSLAALDDTPVIETGSFRIR